MKKKVFFLVFLFWVQALLFSEIVIIANKNSPLDSISKRELYSIYTGKKTSLKGNRVKPVTQLKNLGGFNPQFLRMNVKSFKRLWMRLTLQGKARVPVNLSTDSKVISYVINNDGAIGYINGASISEKVKRIIVSN